MRTTQKQLDDLTRQVTTLLSEKSQLETRTRILEQVVYLNTNHEQMLHANQVHFDPFIWHAMLQIWYRLLILHCLADVTSDCIAS